MTILIGSSWLRASIIRSLIKPLLYLQVYTVEVQRFAQCPESENQMVYKPVPKCCASFTRRYSEFLAVYSALMESHRSLMEEFEGFPKKVLIGMYFLFIYSSEGIFLIKKVCSIQVMICIIHVYLTSQGVQFWFPWLWSTCWFGVTCVNINLLCLLQMFYLMFWEAYNFYFYILVL